MRQINTEERVTFLIVTHDLDLARRRGPKHSEFSVVIPVCLLVEIQTGVVGGLRV